jgi:hypothetical protein
MQTNRSILSLLILLGATMEWGTEWMRLTGSITLTDRLSLRVSKHFKYDSKNPTADIFECVTRQKT